MFAHNSSPRVFRCDFFSNTTPAAAGALWLEGCSAFEVEDCVFYQNSAGGYGGAITITGSAGAIRGNTIVVNESGSLGGGIYVDPTVTGSVEISRNIIAGNTTVEGGGIACWEDQVAGSCNDFWNNGENYYICTPFPSDISEDPLFCGLAGEDFGIELGSPCGAEQTPAGCGLIGARAPADCAVIELGPGDSTNATSLRIGAARPNPAHSGATIRLQLPSSGSVRLIVYDASGRVVHDRSEADLAAGVREFAWDGRDRRGNPVAAGVYFYRMEVAGKTITRKLVMLR